MSVFDTLEKTSKEGFDPKETEAILHQLEISQKHVTSSFGMSIAQVGTRN